VKRRGALLVLAAVGGLCGAAAVLLAGASRAGPLAVVDGVPVSVSADQLVIDLNRGSAVLSGNVRLRRGELSVSCARLDARYDEAPNVTWARATGEVRADYRDLHAQARQAELVAGKRVLELRGEVRVWRGGAWIEASEARIELGSGRVTLEQVRGSFPIPSAAPAASGDAAP
jgi:lipopolysaccharide transport protein LptA